MKPIILYITYPGAAPSAGDMDRAINTSLAPHLTGLTKLSGDDGLAAPMPGTTVMLKAMPAPFPASELTNDLAQRGAWPTWKQDSRAWRTHLLAIALASEKSLPGQRAAVSSALQVASAIASHTGADSVGWSANLLFHPTAALADALARAPLPAEILVRCLWRQGSGAPGALAAQTLGLLAFGLPEIDHASTGEDVASIYNRLMNLSTYLLAEGQVLKQGDTIGTDAQAAMRVRHQLNARGELLLALHRTTD